MGDTLLIISDLGKAFDLSGQSEQKLKSLLEGAVFSQLLRRKQSETETKKFWALRHVSFTVRRGESIAIIGKNGSGKTTLLRLIAKVLHESEGSIIRNGSMGSYLGMGAGIHPELTGRENIFVNATLLGIPRTEIARTVHDIIAFAELGEFIDVPVKFYSSGMHARLAFSVAAFQDTGDILLIDEALAAGDAAFCAKCYERLRSLAAQGKTILFATHSMGQARELAARCLYLRRGTLVTDGPTDDVISQYLAEGAPKTTNTRLQERFAAVA